MKSIRTKIALTIVTVTLASLYVIVPMLLIFVHYIDAGYNNWLYFALYGASAIAIWIGVSEIITTIWPSLVTPVMPPSGQSRGSLGTKMRPHTH
jgi:ABC-type sulfate transport system permease subunit